jgi:uncharacterized protein YcfJ
MNRAMLTGVTISAAVAAVGVTVAAVGLVRHATTYATVLDAQPVTRTVRVPHEECAEVTVQKQRPVSDGNRIAGTAVGAVLGGVLGHQIGAGDGRTLATVAGAAAGGYAGNRVQHELQQRDTVATTEQRCRTVTTASAQIVGYDVRYRLGDTVAVVRLKERPGERLAIRDGRPVADAGAAPPG